jgi:hypothetical protein
MPTGKIVRFLLVAVIEHISCCCLHLAEAYPLGYRSIDLSTDPGLKSHWITFPCSEWTAASTKISKLLDYNECTNHVNHKKMRSCLIASK